ncbi:hypothetical protein [Mycobacterium shimoidei]|uniref:hypothetical protein n=1 Tax=Mycobacterium shimoidei TaxID=29313 RepID=UPI0011586293|nr:hypothetical protein [Mycobacterium shimoidei]
MSWTTQHKDTFSVAYQEDVDKTWRQLDMETCVSRAGALDEALNTIREILLANGFDQQPGKLTVTMLY